MFDFHVAEDVQLAVNSLAPHPHPQPPFVRLIP
jgi:hypothetical protein